MFWHWPVTTRPFRTLRTPVCFDFAATSCYHIESVRLLYRIQYYTRSSAVAERPREASCHHPSNDSMRFVGHWCKFDVSFFFVRRQIFRRRWHHRREILHNGIWVYWSRTGPILLGGDSPRIPKIQNFGRLKSEYLENGKLQRYMSIREL